MIARNRAMAKVHKPKLVLSRVFDAPRDLVWRAWTDPVRIADWFGLAGFTMTFGEFDFRVGGQWVMSMTSPKGIVYSLPRVFREITAPSRLVFTDNCYADGKLFFDAITTITFEDNVSRTEVTVIAETSDHFTQEDAIGWTDGWRDLFQRFASHLERSPKPDAELYLTRIFDAPRELVFRAWSDPQRLARWWGPKDFTNPVCKVDARPGGHIRIDMKAQDGTIYPMKGIFHEVTAPERLTFTAIAEDLDGNPLLESFTTVSFHDEGNKTRLVLKATAFGLTPLGKSYLQGMDEGWTQSLGKLTDFINATKESERELLITRTFDAPRDLVFNVFTDTDTISRWWGPNGFTTTTHEIDFRVGGVWRHTMHGPDGTDYPNCKVYTAIERPKRIAYDHYGDRNGPMLFQADVLFEDVAGKTRVTLKLVVKTSEQREEYINFGAVEGGYQTLDRLGQYLAALQSQASASGA